MRYLMGRYGVSARRACRRRRFRPRDRWCTTGVGSDPLTALRQRMRELAQTRVRFGYRRLRVLLRREGWEVGKERFYRVYTEEGLALRRKRPWRHATAVHREQRRPAAARNDIWSMDFVADRNGRWAPIPRADGDRSVHARMPGDRHRPRTGRPGCRRDARAPALRPRVAAADLLRQRDRVRQRGDGPLGVHQQA